MELVNDRYLLSGGVDLLELVEEFGSPLYVYDTAVIKRQFDRIQSAFSVPRLGIHYACKALTNLNIPIVLR